jgi:arylsulfatase A-like enzyme
MKPNILFLLIDSFRADKCFGDDKTSLTPNIDNLIKNNVYFTQAICSAPVTCPSVSSIFTSQYPFESIIQDENHYKINSDITTYIDDLVKLGYFPFAITPELTSYMGLKKIFKNNIETYNSSSTLYDGLGDRLIEKLSSQNFKEPWILYFHLLDLHGSATFQLSDGPKKYENQKYGSNQYERMVSAMDEWIGKIIDKINLENTLIIITSDHGSETGIYTKEIEEYKENIIEYKKVHFESIHKLTSKLPKSFSPLRSTLSNIYSKRKREKLKTKRQAESKKIYENNLNPYEKRILKSTVDPTLELYDDRFRIPLIFAGYGINSHKIITQQVRSIDIFPTIAAIIKSNNETKDRRGQNLLPLIQGSTLEEKSVMIESTPNSPQSLTSNTIGIRTSKYKYFRDRTIVTKNVHLFDLVKDPLEEFNIAASNPNLINKFENELLNIKNNGNFELKKELITNENESIEKELKKLGYI